MKSIFCILIAIFASSAFSQIRHYSYLPEVRNVRKGIARMDQKDVAARADASIDRMIKLAAKQLRAEGHTADADKMEQEWLEKFKGFLPQLIEERMAGLGDIGDHRPLSQWLTDAYDKLLKLLGPEIMALTHLEDIRIVNYTIPVVFHLQGVDGIDAPEYEKHWDPFWGVVTYWTVWGVCTAATWGGGWFIICSPAGVVAKIIVVDYVAPKFSLNGYEFFYKSDLKQSGREIADDLGCIGKNVIDLCK